MKPSCFLNNHHVFKYVEKTKEKKLPSKLEITVYVSMSRKKTEEKILSFQNLSHYFRFTCFIEKTFRKSKQKH